MPKAHLYIAGLSDLAQESGAISRAYHVGSFYEVARGTNEALDRIATAASFGTASETIARLPYGPGWNVAAKRYVPAAGLQFSKPGA